MDPQHPITRIIHEPFDGENLSRENTGGPCSVSPNAFVDFIIDASKAVAVIAMIAGAWLVLCAFQMEMPV